MLTKTLKKMEVSHGFVYIPNQKKFELFGNGKLPFYTKLNEQPARVDEHGRLWSNYLKKRFEANTEVILTRKDDGFQIIAIGQTLIQEGRQSINVFPEDAIK